ncbi:uracil-xanthine permease family protein [Paramaledivibacter caminithermalis]|uniref:Nucleobase:cation symporter-2, NCS2 family n=1 Tax=Paramaledivibacter caminithermalis (strain DSM 15212 / CIP 107654 / DViRD3) TaxID=1121301 RepID=A0A1M6K8B5_PARC5|nr:nucleobase:cation symporter-2 family protein [Paramaledivibacter caminithermalis]SHJ55211.1 nucleobase:cation symporter-2, NCS2 family [Paramaledivibacter caminithermalis DSM 15212]
MISNNKTNTSLFSLEGNPSIKGVIPLSFQHLLAMIVGNVLPALVLSGAIGLTSNQQIQLVQASMFIAAIGTFVQSFSVFGVGAKLPVIMGVSFAYIPTILSIGKGYGIGAIFGAQLIGGIIAFIVGVFIKKIRKYFPPMVAGTVVFTIGLSLYRVAVNYMAGGFRPIDPRYGGLVYWGIAILTLAVVLICNMFGKGYIKLAAILIGIIVGYIASLIAGIVSFDSIGNALWFDLPTILPYKLEFPIVAIITMSVMYVVNSVQAIGDLSATTVGGMDREATDKEISGGIKGNGILSIIGALIGALPTATYSQNVGIVSMTKVISLKVFRITAAMIFAAGLIPKFGAIITSIPQCVIGGATISVFAQITMTGMKLIVQDEMSVRNTTIVGLGVALGMGITQIPVEGLQYLPNWFKMIFASSPVVLATVVVFILNIILPKKTIAEEQLEREIIEKKHNK